MADAESGQITVQELRGRRVLVVEDEYFTANDIARELAKAGAEIVGPVGRLDEALALSRQARIDMAVLDLNLHDEMVYPAADVLIARQVPIVFLTGYDAEIIPPSYAHLAQCVKPIDPERVIEELAKAATCSVAL